MSKSVVILAGLGLLGASVARAGETARLRAIGEGRGIYLTHCASCHGGRALGTTADRNHVGMDVPDLTLIEHRDGTFRAVHVAMHVENRGRKEPMPQWTRVFDHEYAVLPQLQIFKLTKYLDSVQRADASAELVDNPGTYSQ